MTSKISFVIPCYRSEKIVSKVIAEIIEVVSQKSEYDYEIIAVNDCSPDKVMDVLRSQALENDKIKVLDFSRNMGKHAALMAGFRFCAGEFAVCIDDDLQCPMDAFWDLLEPLCNGYDVAIAKYGRKEQSGFKNFGSKMNALMMRVLLDKPKDLQFANFIAMKKFVVDEIVRCENPFPYINGLILKSTSKIANVPMQERARDSGTGGYTFLKSLSLWINGFTAFSVKPLRIATVIGVVCAMAGFLYGLYVIVRKLMIPTIPAGYSSIIAITLFIGGLLMLMLGLIGEYIGRIYISINNAPQYVIREKINLE